MMRVWVFSLVAVGCASKPVVVETPKQDAAAKPVSEASPLPRFPGAGEPELVQGAVKFVSLEGPLWVGDSLLFSDVDASKVYRLVPGEGADRRFEPFAYPRQTNGIGRDVQ